MTSWARRVRSTSRLAGENELAGDDVVAAVGVGGVDAEGIAFGGGDEGKVGAAEGGVAAGVAEVPR